MDSLELFEAVEDFLLLAVALGLVSGGFGGAEWCFGHGSIQLFGVRRKRCTFHHIPTRTHQTISRAIPIRRLLLKQIRIGVNLQRKPIRPLLLTPTPIRPSHLMIMHTRRQTHRALRLAIILTLHILTHLYLGDLHLHLPILLDQLLHFLDGDMGFLQPLVLLL